MTAALARLEQILEETPPSLASIAEVDAARPLAAGKWSRKEILGHLIDSASNNHQRFVRAQLAPHVDLPTYQQEQWVAAQAYVTAPWSDLVNLWVLYNRHLLHIMRSVPKDRLAHTVAIAGGQPVTLSAVFEDYVHHLEHHLKQIAA